MSENSGRRTAIGLIAIALIALAIVALPSGGDVLDVSFATLQAVFLAAIAFSAIRFYRGQSFWLSALAERDRAILYSALSVAMLTVVARGRFREIGDGGSFIWLMSLVACGGAVYWVWRESRRYTI